MYHRYGVQNRKSYLRVRYNGIRSYMECRFEKPTEDDRRSAIDITNYYIEKSFAAYPDVKQEYSVYDNILSEKNIYPRTIIKSTDGEVIGVAFLRPHLPVTTMKRTAETNYFLKPNFTGKGIGKKALDYLITEARKMGIDTLLANISSLNEGSIRFHKKNGFIECGRFHAVGRKFDKDFDIVWMERKI